MSEEAQPVQGQDPAPSTPPAPPAVSGPWAEAVTREFNDPAEAARVDQFMRTHYQPYVTRLENERFDPEAKEFWSKYKEDPGDAFLSLAEELFGEDAIEPIVNALQQGEVIEGEATEEGQQPYQLPPEVQETLTWAQQQRAEQEAAKQQAEYERTLDEFTKKFDYIDKDAFHPFVFAADGDLEVARSAYDNWAKKWGAGPPDPEAAPASAPATPASPQAEQQYGSIDDAMDAMFNEIRSAAPAPPTA